MSSLRPHYRWWLARGIIPCQVSEMFEFYYVHGWSPPFGRMVGSFRSRLVDAYNALGSTTRHTRPDTVSECPKQPRTIDSDSSNQQKRVHLCSPLAYFFRHITVCLKIGHPLKSCWSSQCPTIFKHVPTHLSSTSTTCPSLRPNRDLHISTTRDSRRARHGPHGLSRSARLAAAARASTGPPDGGTCHLGWFSQTLKTGIRSGCFTELLG